MSPYSFPPKQLAPKVWVNPCDEKPIQPSQAARRDDLHVGDVHLEGLGDLKDILQDLTTKVDILMEAITMAHQLGPDGKCRDDCWSCKVQETMRGIKVARKLGAPEKTA